MEMKLIGCFFCPGPLSKHRQGNSTAHSLTGHLVGKLRTAAPSTSCRSRRASGSHGTDFSHMASEQSCSARRLQRGPASLTPRRATNQREKQNSGITSRKQPLRPPTLCSCLRTSGWPLVRLLISIISSLSRLHQPPSAVCAGVNVHK